jgi:hypothetical protein
VDKSPAVEDLEQVRTIIDEASLKYKEATSLIEKAFEIILSARAEENISEFLGKGANKHRKLLIRQIALLLEEESEKEIDQRIDSIRKEAHQALVFIRRLEKAS